MQMNVSPIIQSDGNNHYVSASNKMVWNAGYGVSKDEN